MKLTLRGKLPFITIRVEHRGASIEIDNILVDRVGEHRAFGLTYWRRSHYAEPLRSAALAPWHRRPRARVLAAYRSPRRRRDCAHSGTAAIVDLGALTIERGAMRGT
jgi:hypothetical protein